LDAIQRKCLACGEPFTGVSRRQKYCSQKCRPSDQNTFQGPLHWGAENQDLSCLQPIDFIEAACPEIQEQEPSLPRASSRKELLFEEWPPRVSKKASCVTYKLTDRKQINTGYGRASRPLGYVMETSPGRWVARVRNRRSNPLPLGAAKKAAIELYRSRDKGEPRDWIKELTQLAANEVDRAVIQRERRKWPVDLMGGPRRSLVDRELRQAILDAEIGFIASEEIELPTISPYAEEAA
jgi:hypothetical protein